MTDNLAIDCVAPMIEWHQDMPEIASEIECSKLIETFKETLVCYYRFNFILISFILFTPNFPLTLHTSCPSQASLHTMSMKLSPYLARVSTFSAFSFSYSPSVLARLPTPCERSVKDNHSFILMQHKAIYSNLFNQTQVLPSVNVLEKVTTTSEQTLVANVARQQDLCLKRFTGPSSEM